MASQWPEEYEEDVPDDVVGILDRRDDPEAVLAAVLEHQRSDGSLGHWTISHDARLWESTPEDIQTLPTIVALRTAREDVLKLRPVEAFKPSKSKKAASTTAKEQQGEAAGVGLASEPAVAQGSIVPSTGSTTLPGDKQEVVRQGNACSISYADISRLQPDLLARLPALSYLNGELELPLECPTTGRPGPNPSTVNLYIQKEKNRHGKFYLQFKGNPRKMNLPGNFKATRSGSFYDACAANVAANLLMSVPLELRRVAGMGRRLLEEILPPGITEDDKGSYVRIQPVGTGWELLIGPDPAHLAERAVVWGSTTGPLEMEGVVQPLKVAYYGCQVFLRNPTADQGQFFINPFSATTMDPRLVVGSIYQGLTGTPLPQDVLAPVGEPEDDAQLSQFLGQIDDAPPPETAPSPEVAPADDPSEDDAQISSFLA